MVSPIRKKHLFLNYHFRTHFTLTETLSLFDDITQIHYFISLLFFSWISCPLFLFLTNFVLGKPFRRFLFIDVFLQYSVGLQFVYDVREQWSRFFFLLIFLIVCHDFLVTVSGLIAALLVDKQKGAIDI